MSTASVPGLPPLIGHRGARAHAPENTLAGIKAAAAAGARWVEVDVKLTRDNVAVLMHDDTLGRTTTGKGRVAETDFAAIRALDAGMRFSAAHAGETVPTLAETVACVLALGLGLNLELKPCPGREVETARRVLAEARRLWPGDRPPPLVSSFSVASLEIAREAAPDWPRGYLIDRRPRDWAGIAGRIGAATINVNAGREDAASIAAYRATGRPVLAYTVNDPGLARRLFEWGVAAVFTDTPGPMRAALGA